MGGVVEGGQGEPRFDIADIIATDIDHPHMVLEHIRREKIVNGDTYYRNQYRLLALLTGRTTIIDIDQVDAECTLHENLTQQYPKTFDGRLSLIDGGMAFYIRGGITGVDAIPIQAVTVTYNNIQHGTLGVQGGEGGVGGVINKSLLIPAQDIRWIPTPSTNTGY